MFDVPRSSQQYISYTGIEEIKNGIFSSPKYESCMVAMPPPHVVVLCNIPPDYTDTDLSSDRISEWCVDGERVKVEDQLLTEESMSEDVLVSFV